MPTVNSLPRADILLEDPQLRKAVRFLLEDLCDCRLYEDGQAYLEAAAFHERPAVLLLDVHLPRVSGPEVVRRLRKAGVMMPVVWYAMGNNMAGVRSFYAKDALQGTMCFVEKRAPAAELRATVQSLLPAPEEPAGQL